MRGENKCSRSPEYAGVFIKAKEGVFTRTPSIGYKGTRKHVLLVMKGRCTKLK